MEEDSSNDLEDAMEIEAGVNRDGVLGNTTCRLKHLNGLKGGLVENSLGFVMSVDVVLGDELGGEIRIAVVREQVDTRGVSGGVLHIGDG